MNKFRLFACILVRNGSLKTKDSVYNTYPRIPICVSVLCILWPSIEKVCVAFSEYTAR